MQLINKKNFLSIICSVYTIISLSKIIVEIMLGHKDTFYAENFLTIFIISVVATLVLGLHYYLQNVPLLIVILGQYIFLVGIIMLGLWIESNFIRIEAAGYRDMYVSFTGPYVIGASAYYVTFLLQLRKANRTLAELKKDGGNLE